MRIFANFKTTRILSSSYALCIFILPKHGSSSKKYSKRNMQQNKQTKEETLLHFYVGLHTRLTALCPGLPGWASTRKVKPIWILLKQETVSGSPISWTICMSAPHSRQIANDQWPWTFDHDFDLRALSGCDQDEPARQIRHSLFATEHISMGAVAPIFPKKLAPYGCPYHVTVHWLNAVSNDYSGAKDDDEIFKKLFIVLDDASRRRGCERSLYGLLSWSLAVMRLSCSLVNVYAKLVNVSDPATNDKTDIPSCR